MKDIKNKSQNIKDLYIIVNLCLYIVLEICPEFLQNAINNKPWLWNNTITLGRIVITEHSLKFGYKHNFEMLLSSTLQIKLS